MWDKETAPKATGAEKDAHELHVASSTHVLLLVLQESVNSETA